MKDVIYHYDKLIDENNDPVHDPAPLKEYMDKWDGEKFIKSMKLDKSSSVLEIGVGTGRLAAKVAPLCHSFWGIDVSPKTIERAKENLCEHTNVKLICDDFTSFDFLQSFDVIYSSLTFMHIKDKKSTIKKVASILNDNGIFVLSIDKDQNEYIDMGTRKIKIYPDDPNDTCKFILDAKLNITERFETENAHIIISKRSQTD